jgi:hypothetical protein
VVVGGNSGGLGLGDFSGRAVSKRMGGRCRTTRPSRRKLAWFAKIFSPLFFFFAIHAAPDTRDPPRRDAHRASGKFETASGRVGRVGAGLATRDFWRIFKNVDDRGAETQAFCPAAAAAAAAARTSSKRAVHAHDENNCAASAIFGVDAPTSAAHDLGTGASISENTKVHAVVARGKVDSQRSYPVVARASSVCTGGAQGCRSRRKVSVCAVAKTACVCACTTAADTTTATTALFDIVGRASVYSRTFGHRSVALRSVALRSVALRSVAFRSFTAAAITTTVYIIAGRASV